MKKPEANLPDHGDPKAWCHFCGHRIMRTIYGIVGTVGIAFAVVLANANTVSNEDFWFGWFSCGASAAGAVALLTAAIKGYRGGWPFLMGTILLFLAFTGVGDNIDSFLAQQPAMYGISALLLGSGVLLLLSGHKLHRSLVQLELLRSSGGTAGNPDTEPVASSNSGPATPLGDPGVTKGPPSVS